MPATTSTDSARTIPSSPGADKAAQALGAKLVARAQGATATGQYDNAGRMLSEARAVGYVGADLGAAEAALRTAQAPAVAASPPKQLKYVAPQYPQDAISRGVEGWVDVSFGVTASGGVVDVRVDDAKPRNQFDRAALAAVRQWKYEPSADGLDREQRLKTRVQFKLHGLAARFSMSKVVRVHEHGGPEVLRIEELDVGQPGAGEVRLRIEAIGLNRSEAAFRAGLYPVKPKLPTLIGYEAAGVIESLGEGVKEFAVGDRVCVLPTFRLGEYGVYADTGHRAST